MSGHEYYRGFRTEQPTQRDNAEFEKSLRILGLKHPATKEEARKAYRGLARKYHPDVSSEPDANRRMAEINNAYEFLVKSGRLVEDTATTQREERQEAAQKSSTSHMLAETNSDTSDAAKDRASSPLDQSFEGGNRKEIEQKQPPTGMVTPANSPLTHQETSDKGGIDFRALPIQASPLNVPSLNLNNLPIKRLDNINLDTEWKQIQNMLKAGIIPSNQRIKEYLLASCQNGNLNEEIDSVLGCIANIMRMEEERVSDTDAELRNLLVLIESGKPESQLQRGLSQITISPREPRQIGQ